MNDVSVIVPTFNRADLLMATVESILSQTQLPREILIINDGSTDGTEAACERFGHPVRVINQVNTGLPGARNRGIKEAKGQWLAFCDSDDLWYPNKLELQLAALRNIPGAQWCITDCQLIDPGGGIQRSERTGFERLFPVFDEKCVSPDDHFGAALTRVVLEHDKNEVTSYHGDLYDLFFEGNLVLPSSAVISRAVVESAGMFDESFRVAEETEYFHRVAAVADVVIVMEPLVYYRKGHTSITSTSSLRLIENALLSGDRAIRLREPSEATLRAYREGRSRLQLRLAYTRVCKSDGPGARDALREAWKDPVSRTATSVIIFFASLLPWRIMVVLHRIKRLRKVSSHVAAGPPDVADLPDSNAG